MNRRTIGISLIAILALLLPATASQQTGQSGVTTQQGDTKTSQNLSNTDRNFIMHAAHDGMAEVEMAKLAVQRASSDEVKQFAQRLIDDHSRANTELMQLATSKGVTMPSDANHSGHSHATQGDTATTSTTSQTSGEAAKSHHMDKKHQNMAQKLGQLSGEEFDREYMRQMVKDHEKAVSLFQKEASKGDDAEVKAWAAKTLPALQEHLRMAREISGKHKSKKG